MLEYIMFILFAFGRIFEVLIYIKKDIRKKLLSNHTRFWSESPTSSNICHLEAKLDDINFKIHHTLKNCPYSEFFWSVFFCIWTEFGEIRVSLRIQSECGKMWTWKTPNLKTFHAVHSIGETLSNIYNWKF